MPGGVLVPPAFPRRVSLLLLLGLLLAAPSAGRAQATLSITLSGGGTLPAGAFRDGPGTTGQTESDASLGVHFDLRTSSRRGLRVGFSQHHFGCGGACPGGGELVSTGWDLGGSLRFAGSGVAPWVGAGLVVARVERKGTPLADGPEPAVSDLSVGGEVGLGLVVPAGPRFAFRPEARWVMLNTRFPDGLLRMRYGVVGLAFMVGF